MKKHLVKVLGWMRLHTLALATILLLAGVIGTLAAPPAPRTEKLGSKIEHLTLRDADGKNLRAANSDVTVELDFRKYFLHSSITTDDYGGALDAHVFHTIKRFLFPDTV